MNIPFSRYSSWIALLVAVALWAGVGYFARMITIAAEEHGTKIAGMEQEEMDRAAALRLHALARDTKEARTKLEQLSDADILELVDTIEALAHDAGIPIQTGAPSISSKEGSPVRVASFVIEAQGTFAEVTQLIALIESLPTPSTHNEVRLERIPSTGERKSARNWRIVMPIHIFTTADIPAI